jgi:uncharacterized protein
MSIDQTPLGSVVALWRYPVKSMIGEELNAADVAQRGILGDRAYALIDASSGKVVSAKNPRKWATLFDFRAGLVETPRRDAPIPPARITLPGGRIVTSHEPNIDQILSNALGHQVHIGTLPPETPALEEYWPDMAGLPHRDTITDETILEGTFFDGAVLHVLTTATIDHLRELYPQGRFEVRRFRPNIVVGSSTQERAFVEDRWIGHTVVIGTEVHLSITRACQRCVMTTLPQGDLPKDPGILRAAAQNNEGNVGVYAAVLRGGTIRRGDPVALQ